MMLDGKLAVVTGAGGGIGREVAMALAGAAIVVNDIGASLAGEGQSATSAEQTRQMTRRSRPEGRMDPRIKSGVTMVGKESKSLCTGRF